MIFNLGVTLCYLSIPTPLAIALADGSVCAVVLTPAVLLATGLALMELGWWLDWGRTPQPPDALVIHCLIDSCPWNTSIGSINLESIHNRLHRHKTEAHPEQLQR